MLELAIAKVDAVEQAARDANGCPLPAEIVECSDGSAGRSRRLASSWRTRRDGSTRSSMLAARATSEEVSNDCGLSGSHSTTSAVARRPGADRSTRRPTCRLGRGGEERLSPAELRPDVPFYVGRPVPGYVHGIRVQHPDRCSRACRSSLDLVLQSGESLLNRRGGVSDWESPIKLVCRPRRAVHIWGVVFKRSRCLVRS